MADYKDTETKPRLRMEEIVADLKRAGIYIEKLRD
jgi:hypothetical protein